ncbi:hypothetical protein ACHAWF_018161 [Thalassiosira exigua]
MPLLSCNQAHSGGTDGQGYTDHGCLMGNPLFEDNVMSMCFNPAKNYQIARGMQGWYDAQYIRQFNSGTAGGTSWRGRIVGVSDYNNNPKGHIMVLKLEAGNPQDWFLGFNRASGMNYETQAARDSVTIHSVKSGEGMGYSTSRLQGTLKAGKSATVNNWRNSGMALIIKVVEINTWASPGYADVEILFGPQPPPTKMPTRRPTNKPTKPTQRPTARPTRRPTNRPTARPTNRPTRRPSNRPTRIPTKIPTPGPTFAILSTTPAPTKKPTPAPTKQPTPSFVDLATNWSWDWSLDTKSGVLNEEATTESEGPLPYCPPPYDPLETNHQPGQLVELDSFAFQCNEETPYRYYCNVAEWDDALLEDDTNARKYWEGAWLPIHACYATLSPTEQPDPCGNAVCEAWERPETCPDDCIQKGLSTASANNAYTLGIMFSVNSRIGEVRVTSFDVIGYYEGNYECAVYTRDGDYSGYEADITAWELIFHQEAYFQKNTASNMGALDREVVIPEKATQAFYIICSNWLVYTKENKNEVASLDTDTSLVISTGLATKKLFQVNGAGQFGGVIRYYKSLLDETATPTQNPTKKITEAPTVSSCGNSVCNANESPETCPGDCTLKSLDTISMGNAYTGGLMFSVDSRVRGVRVTSFDVVGYKEGYNECAVYTRAGDYSGYEADITAWELIFHQEVHLLNKVPTNLGVLNKEVLIAAGSTRAFYILCSNGLLYKKENGWEEADPLDTDTSLVINRGLATKKMFANVKGGGQFSGAIKYIASHAP